MKINFINGVSGLVFMMLLSNVYSADIESPSSCEVCGMDRTEFAFSRAVIVYTDGTVKGTCSINCAYNAVTQDSGRKISNIRIADFSSRKLIDSEKAFWVLDKKRGGVMSPYAKWAFEKKTDAEKYISENGAELIDFKKIWESLNNEVSQSGHCSIHKQHGVISSGFSKLKKSDKCPVCGMFVSGNDVFLAGIQFTDKSSLFFDGPKDFFKYYLGIFNHKKKREKIGSIFVTDYYSVEPADAEKAFFVYGSDVSGPMGRELVPFTNKNDAAEFSRDHGGKKILGFKEITEEIIRELN